MNCGARLPVSEATSTAKVMVLRDGRPCGRDGCMSRPSCKAFILRLFFLLHDLCISVRPEKRILTLPSQPCSGSYLHETRSTELWASLSFLASPRSPSAFLCFLFFPSLPSENSQALTPRLVCKPLRSGRCLPPRTIKA